MKDARRRRVTAQAASGVPVCCRAVSAVLIRARSERAEVLLLKRAISLAGTWCQVAGGIEAGETAWQAAVREIAEETGLTPEALYSADYCEQCYEVDRDRIAILPVFVGFVAADCHVALNEEHSAYRWVTFADAARMVTFAGRRAMLAHVEAEFVLRAPPALLRIALG